MPATAGLKKPLLQGSAGGVCGRSPSVLGFAGEKGFEHHSPLLHLAECPGQLPVPAGEMSAH